MLCSVFISSTSEDLLEYREAAAKAIRNFGLHAVDMSDFPASACPPLEVCRERVGKAELVVVVVAHRYGWVPLGGPDFHSVTWLECLHAVSLGKDVLAFLVDPKLEWPEHRKEAYRLAAAATQNPFPVELPAEVQRNMAKLVEFKQWLDSGRTRATFTSPDDLRAKITVAVTEWLDLHPACKSNKVVDHDRTPYLNWVFDDTAYINIQGLGFSAGKAHNFPIGELYIPLTTPLAKPRGAEHGLEKPEERKSMDLDEALEHPRLVIVGDPGSGKTTYLRRLAHNAAEKALADSGAPIPLPIKIADLVKHIHECRKSGKDAESSAWLAHYLGVRNAALGWGVSEAWFAKLLRDGRAVVLLDGLDEAPDAETRAEIARAFEYATVEFKKCRFVVTTRPQAYVGEALLRGFHEARIEPLEKDAVALFFRKWSSGLYPDLPEKAQAHAAELTAALAARPEIRRLASNPVMLTALAVVHWNERRVPEQRADLYEAILWWLSRQRETQPGREKADRCLRLLQALALAMQDHEEGHKVSVPLDWAAGALAREFSGPPEAAAFLQRETVDSGIIVTRGDVQFWHLTFREYLAARAIAAMGDDERIRVLFDGDKLYRPEWREVVLLLAGILANRGLPQVDVLANAVFDRMGDGLPGRARAAGLLGAIVRDLRPFGYQPSAEAYRKLMHAILPIFEVEAGGIPFEIRLEAADALGLFGDPRFERPNQNRALIQKHGRVKAFWIGRYPVTVGEFRAFVDAGGYAERHFWEAGGFGQYSEPRNWEQQQRFPNVPVVCISWYAAKAYCRWAGGYLPTEAEWKLAAYGPEAREYPWSESRGSKKQGGRILALGDDGPDATRANYWETGPQRTTPVGLYPKGGTPEGVQDMAGNVREWTSSLYEGNSSDASRVLRGGAWLSLADGLRSEARSGFRPGHWDYEFGLRVAWEA
jgi:formylglycine-generating enzyme required for sulfatase activity